MPGEKILGLDIGTNSVGWCLLERAESGKFDDIIDLGVRIYEAGAEIDGTGKAVSKNQARREARAMRRHYDRRRRRKTTLRGILRTNGFLPDMNDLTAAFLEIDCNFVLRAKIPSLDKRRIYHTLPYLMRTYTLDNEVNPYELGRIIYHLAQRRGFLSNRKAEPKKDEDPGIVKKEISRLQQDISESGSRTLGEYFSKLDPELTRIRGQHTSRQMYMDEFDAIWEAQRAFLPSLLCEKLKAEIGDAIFFQRKLKSAARFIGECSLEKKRKRCPWYRFEAQEFRILKTVNNLRVEIDGNPERVLTPDERAALLNELSLRESLSFTEAKKILGQKPRGCKFNLERGGEKKLIGNRTAVKLIEVFSPGRWEGMSSLDREQVLEDLNAYEDAEALFNRAIKRWELDNNKAAEFSALSLEKGYCNFSASAIRKLMPHLREGLSEIEAIEMVYGRERLKTPVMDRLPPIVTIRELANIRNPIVNRCFTEIRGIVNSVIARYGKPDYVRVELAREIKNSRKERERIIKQNRDNEKSRETARNQIAKEAHIADPSRNDILKYLLHEECNKICPFTGRSISMESLFGQHPEFDIEHIIPYSVSLDDSFMNKTLCERQENVHVKRKQSPWQAYSGNEEKYYEIIERVKRFKGNGRNAKLRRFLLQDTAETEDFTSRMLNDTRYASRKTADYLALLYGGRVDEGGNLRIQTVTGQVTACVRNYLGLNRILGQDRKSRDDHRHHVVDAFAVAYTGAGTVQAISRHAARSESLDRVNFKADEPWQREIVARLRARIEQVIPAHRNRRRLRGPLHDETIYRRGTEAGAVHLRKPLTSLKERDIVDIVDRGVRNAVRTRLDEKERATGSRDPSKVFADPRNLPFLVDHATGECRTIRNVRLLDKRQVVKIGTGDGARLVWPRNNHHVEIVAVLDGTGAEIKWEGHVVTLIEALLRKKRGEPVVMKDFGPGRRFKFSLCGGDSIELTWLDGARKIAIVRTIAEVELALARATDARMKKDIIAGKEWLRTSYNGLMKACCRKVFLTPFSEVRYAND